MTPNELQIILLRLTEEELSQLDQGNIIFAMRINTLKCELFDELSNG